MRADAGDEFEGCGKEEPDYREMKLSDDTLEGVPAVDALAGAAAELLGIGGDFAIDLLFITLGMRLRIASQLALS